MARRGIFPLLCSNPSTPPPPLHHTQKVRTCLIINPNAGSADRRAELRRAVEATPSITWRETTAPGDAGELAQRAPGEGFACVAAAGGDGTVNEVVNGLMQCGGAARLGVVPLGTGNDLARTLGIPIDPRDAVAVLDRGRDAAIDLIEVEFGDQRVWGINAAAGGFSGQVDKSMTAEAKKRWGPLAYLFGAAGTMLDLSEYDTRLAFDDEPEEAIKAVNIVVTNGRTVAGGKRVAPRANPCDGLLDVVIVRWAPMLDLAEVGARLMAGNYLDSEHVVHRQVRRVHVASEPGMWFNVDGELLTHEPITFTARPGALRVVVGPAFQAEPEQG